MGFLSFLPLLLISQAYAQFAPITLNKAALGLQTLILSNGQRVRVFPIPIQRSRVLHFKARKDGYIYRASHEIDDEKSKTPKQNVYEPISSKLERHDDFKRNIKNLATTTPTTTTSRISTTKSFLNSLMYWATKKSRSTKQKNPKSSTPSPIYLGTNAKAKNGDFLVPQIGEKETRKESLIDDGSGSGEEMKGDQEDIQMVEGKVQKKLLKKGLPLIVDTLSQEIDGEIEDLLSEKVAGKPEKAIDFKNQTENEGLIPVENPKDYTLDKVGQGRTHEITHAPNRHPELKIDGKKIVLPRIKYHENEKNHDDHHFTEPIRDHFGNQIPHTELHISPNATVSEIKAKILLLNQELLKLQEYVSTHTLNRRVKRQARGAGPQGDAGLAHGSSGQVTAFVPLPNGDVQKFYLNPAQVGSIANPTASGPQITLGQRGDLFGSDGAVAVSPLGGVQQLGIGSPYGGLSGFGGGTSSYQTFGGFGGQYQTGAYPVSSGYGQSSFGGQQQYGQQGGGGQASGQASNIPPPILEIKVPPPPKVDIPGCYVNGKGFVCCNKHLENVIDNTMKEINDKAKEQEAKTGQPACNLQASANLLQKSAEGVFGVSFESLVAPTDFASRTRFMDDLMCKTEQNGKYVIMYATPVAYPIARRR